MKLNYSVLMSVYKREKAEYLKAAIESMIRQSLPPDEIILVCDGPLTEELDTVIKWYEESLRIIRLKRNCGLGSALAIGLQYCKNELVARMDSDDLAMPNRCFMQVNYLNIHPEVDVLSGTVIEFEGDAETVTEAQKYMVSYKRLPSSHDDICEFIKYRNPINHPCVIFRKSKVTDAGGYRDCRYFEDYDLWTRMYKQGSCFSNISEPILLMRVNKMYARRGGFQYAKAIMNFNLKLYRRDINTLPQCMLFAGIRIFVSIMPSTVRKKIYNRQLRK